MNYCIEVSMAYTVEVHYLCRCNPDAKIEAKRASSVTDIVKEIKISDAILHAKVACEVVEQYLHSKVL